MFRNKLIKLLVCIFFIFSLSFFGFKTFHSRSQQTQATLPDYSIDVTGFTASNYGVGETGVSYTVTFTAPKDTTYFVTELACLNAEGDDTFADMTNSSIGHVKINNETIAPDGGGNWTENVMENNRSIAVNFQGENSISEGDTVEVQVDNITNPGSPGSYYPWMNYVYGSDVYRSYYLAAPKQVFDDPGNPVLLLKAKITEPDGTTAVQGATVGIHTANYNKDAWMETDNNGQVFLFANGIYRADGEAVNDTYVMDVIPPTSSEYSSPAQVTGISIVQGETRDYTSGDNGPILLTTPYVKGTLKVPSGCDTCSVGAGTTVPQARIDVRDGDMNPNNFVHTETSNSGIFRVGSLSVGSYTLEIKLPFNSQDYLGLTAPDPITFTVNADGEDADSIPDSVIYGETTVLQADYPLDFGDIEFAVANKTITGTVTKNGAGVNGAQIQAFNMNGTGFSQTSTDSNGEYSLKVGSGTWHIMPTYDMSANYDSDNSNDVSMEWIYCGMGKAFTFTDNEEETKSGNDFTVSDVDSTVTGKLALPNGNVPSSGGVQIFSKNGCGIHSPMNYETGSFSANLPSGTYTLTAESWMTDYGSPASKTITLSGNSVDVGTLTFTEKNAEISGRLWADKNTNNQYDSGEGVGNVRVEAFKVNRKFDEHAGGPGGSMGGHGGWATTESSNETATKGEFTLKVEQGTWMVNVMADMGMMHGGYSDTSTNYVYTGSPQQVNITSDNSVVSSQNFKLQIADATIKGRLYADNNDNNQFDTGEAVSGIYGYSFAEPAGTYNQGPMMGAGTGAPINNGSFTIKAPAGDYKVGVDFPPETSNYTASGTSDVTAVAGSTSTVNIKIVPNNATLQVCFKNTSGQLITNLSQAEVFLNNSSGAHMWRMFNSTDLVTGCATTTTSAGVWGLGYHIDPTYNNYVSEPFGNDQVTTVANQTATKNITLREANSTISGTAKDPNGSPLSGVFISADNRKSSNFDMAGPMLMRGDVTDSNGQYSLSVAAGTYKVAAFYPPEAVVAGSTVNYLNPEPQEITVADGATQTANFSFAESDATLTGAVTLNGNSQGAFVVAYSDKGGYNETTTSTGSYSLNITQGTTWYVRAMYESGSSFYISDVYAVDTTGNSSPSQNLALSVAPFTIPDPVSTTFNCANAKKITLSNGTEISIPASAITPSSVQSCSSSSSESNITVTVTPTAQMSLQNKSVPIGVGYEITAVDRNGSAISDTFNSNVTITIPYSDEEIETAVGGSVDESLLGNGYWDTATSAWRNVDNQVLDTTNNKLTVSTNHFTLYGILAATDPSSTGGSSGSENSTTSTGASSGDSEVKADIKSNEGKILEKENNRVMFMIPPGAVEWDAMIDVVKMNEGEFSKPTPPLWVAAGPFKTTMKTWWNDVVFNDFLKPVSLILRYDPASLGDVPEKSLRINYWDQTCNRWRPLSSVLMLDRHEVAAVINNLESQYALIGGFGYQGAAQYADSTTTVESSGEEVGIDQELMPKKEVSDSGESGSLVPQSQTQEKVSLFGRILNWIKGIFIKD